MISHSRITSRAQGKGPEAGNAFGSLAFTRTLMKGEGTGVGVGAGTGLGLGEGTGEGLGAGTGTGTGLGLGDGEGGGGGTGEGAGEGSLWRQLNEYSRSMQSTPSWMTSLTSARKL